MKINWSDIISCGEIEQYVRELGSVHSIYDECGTITELEEDGNTYKSITFIMEG